MKRFFLLTTVLVAFAVPVHGEMVNRIAAVVNEDIITTYQLDREVQIRAATSEVPPEGKQTVRRQVLDNLIEETLIRQRTEELGIRVTEEELDAAVADVLRQNKLDLPQLEDALRREGMSLAEYRESLRQQILRYKLLGREVQTKAEVTTQEIRDYFRDNIDKYREPPTVRLNRLTFPLPTQAAGEQVQTVRRQAEEALTRLRRGEDFTALLEAYSADGRAEGGDMGRFAPGELTATFEQAVRDLQQGEVSGLVETPQGFHILQVAERQPGRTRQFDSVKDEIAKTLGERKTKTRMREWMTELREKAAIDIRI